jgi:hypothetical protein
LQNLAGGGVIAAGATTPVPPRDQIVNITEKVET